MKLKRKDPVFRITFTALSIALYVALAFVSIRLPGQEITFKGLPLILASIISGPLDGVLVALCGEFLAQLFSPYGLTVTTPLWILPHVARALIVGLMMMHKDAEKNKNTWVFSVILSGIVVTILNSLVMLIDGIIFEYNAHLTTLLILIRAASSITVSIIYIIVIPLLIKPLKRLNKISC